MNIPAILMTLNAGFHVVIVMLWTGVLASWLLIIKPTWQQYEKPTGLLLQTTEKCQNLLWWLMGLSLASGVYRIVQLGGMKHLPTVIHIKLVLVIIMVLLTLANGLMILPKMVVSAAEGDPLVFHESLKAYTRNTWLAFILQIGIIGLLAYGGLL
ncbi:MAG: hypothetical protein K2X01_07315 [Cyanobacteria bacterium]|nr:hypothetical protein [Cyanobacteriota bacterium]